MEERVRVRNYTPAQRLRRNEYDRIWHERRRRQMGVRPISQSEHDKRYGKAVDAVDPLLPVAPFREWLLNWMKTTGMSREEIVLIAFDPKNRVDKESALRKVYRWEHGEAKSVRLDDVDRILVLVAGQPDQMVVMYPDV
jgi:hypothetical protein